MPILRSFTVMMMRENNFVIQQYIKYKPLSTDVHVYSFTRNYKAIYISL